MNTLTAFDTRAILMEIASVEFAFGMIEQYAGDQIKILTPSLKHGRDHLTKLKNKLLEVALADVAVERIAASVAVDPAAGDERRIAP